ncbi:MAG: quinone-dependent dihydroorotate dehydrogenase [Legionella sp.]|nr:quinone-dependent dihydroorotate dehydrogenase [Legionella sp.]
MYSLVRPLLFRLEPETAHTLTLSALQYIPKICFKQPNPQPVDAMGITFPHPVGLAAGLDKNGDHLDALSKLGFSFIELGTVTPKAQEGNVRPRLFRLPQHQAIINRMGFNNKGVNALVANVKKSTYRGILGINIGKNKDTSLNKAAEDYLYCMTKVYEYASYITINISSPNTPELRQLQQKEYFGTLLLQLKNLQSALAQQYQRQVPLVVKISPDETDEIFKQMADIIVTHGVEGIIATNTTSSRVGLSLNQALDEVGGLSGAPLEDLSTRCLALLKMYVGNTVTLIGAGGLSNVLSARRKIAAGADLLQVYSGLIYQGPGLVYDLVEGLT